MMYRINQVIVIISMIMAVGFSWTGNKDIAILSLGWAILFSIFNQDYKE